MTQQIINIGQTSNDKSGDPLRTAFDKINQNFRELYNLDRTLTYHLGNDEIFVDLDPNSGVIVIQSLYNSSMPVYIKGANCSQDGVGGDVIIEAGAPPLAAGLIQGSGPYAGTVGNVQIAANQTTIESLGNLWTFGNDGVLTLPENGYIADSTGTNILDGLGGTTLPTDAIGFLQNDGNGNLSWVEITNNTNSAQTSFNSHSPELTYEELSVYITPNGTAGIQNLSAGPFQFQIAGSFIESSAGHSTSFGSNYQVLQRNNVYNIPDVSITNIGDLLTFVISIPDVSKIFKVTVIGGYNTGNPSGAAGYGNIIIERLI